jgi:uncharacterized membrane protein
MRDWLLSIWDVVLTVLNKPFAALTPLDALKFIGVLAGAWIVVTLVVILFGSVIRTDRDRLARKRWKRIQRESRGPRK